MEFCCSELFIELVRREVRTKSLVVGVLIASEENTEIPGVGVETLMEKGRLDFLKDGPVIWTDSSNSQPRIGTAGVIAWTLTATGKLFHSGLPNQGINAIELAMDAVTELQKRFYADFGPVEEEKAYNYACPSTIKPARAESAPSGLNQMYDFAGNNFALRSSHYLTGRPWLPLQSSLGQDNRGCPVVAVL